MVRLVRLERTTCGLEVRCSIQLSYRRVCFPPVGPRGLGNPAAPGRTLKQLLIYQNLPSLYLLSWARFNRPISQKFCEPFTQSEIVVSNFEWSGLGC